MSITDQFWQYAREAMLSACDAKDRRRDASTASACADLDLSGISRAAICQWRQPDCGPHDVSCSGFKFLGRRPTTIEKCWTAA